MKCNDCKRSWLYFGIISGFLSGFFSFAFAVYTHSHNKVHRSPSVMNSQYDRAGTTL
jgi:hypothetical protein